MRFAGAGIVAGARGRVWRRRTITWSVAALSLLTLLWLGACALPGIGAAPPAQMASRAPTATATPLPWMGAPHALPAGWQVYYATHFTLALPADWRVEKVAQPDSTPTPPHVTYRLYAPILNAPQTGNPDVGVVVEWDGLTPAQMREEFCTPTADDTVRTIAGLSMRFSVGYGPAGGGVYYDPFEYDWTLISDHGTVYWFWFYVGPDGAVGHNQKIDNAIIETFAPQYATWGCS